MSIEKNNSYLQPAGENTNGNSMINRGKPVVTAIIIAFLYYATARLSLLLAIGSTNASPVWPPSGIALAAILFYGYRAGWAVLSGAFFANMFVLKGLGLIPLYFISVSFSTAIGNMLEAIIGVYFIRRFIPAGNPFENIKDLLIFIIYACLLNSMISATTGVCSYSIATGNWKIFITMWSTWWLGDASGILIVSPLIILIGKKMPVGVPSDHVPETIVAFILLISVSLVIFFERFQVEYIIIPILVWIALRLGILYSAVAILLVSGIAVACLTWGALYSGNDVSRWTLLLVQTYIGVISIISLCLSVLSYERSVLDKSRLAVQKQLYDIIEFLPDATFAIDIGGKVIAWNRAIEELSGISKNDMLGKMEYEYAIPFFGERRPILIDLVMKNHDSSHLETYEYLEKKGMVLTAERYNPRINRYLSGAASALMDSEGNVYGAIESIRDITDRKTVELELKHYKENLEEIIKERNSELLDANRQLVRRIEYQERAEKALAESERNYRDLVESANSIILRWKTDGSITFLNNYAQKFFGFMESEIIGRNIMGTIVPVVESSGRDLSELIKDIVLNPEAHVFNENENIRKNSDKVWIAWTNKSILDESGNVMEILSIGNDITGRKLIEESLKNTLRELAVAKEQAEAADRIKSAFLATMSHELRTPLNSIIGFTGVVLMGLAGPLNDEQNKQMGMVKASAQHLLSLINDILDISKIEAGQFEIYNEPFDLRPVIDKAVAALKPQAEKKGLSLDVSISDEICEARGDARRVEQVLLNLISNAVKFTEHGTVKLMADIINWNKPPAADGSGDTEKAIRIMVEDTGIGIEAEDLAKLFQPFHQIDTGLTRKNEGTGLGLAICRRLAELMEGNIAVESEWGKGSTFSFIFPMKGRNSE